MLVRTFLDEARASILTERAGVAPSLRISLQPSARLISEGLALARAGCRIEDDYELGQEIGRCAPALPDPALRCATQRRAIPPLLSHAARCRASPSGTNSTVLLGRHRRSQQLLAIKVVDKMRVARREQLRDEVVILTRIQHPNVITLYELFESDRYLFLVMELCVPRGLRTIARTIRSLTPPPDAAGRMVASCSIG